jgi:hydrogenase expression/formation protein HypC
MPFLSQEPDMCLGIPGKIVSIAASGLATVDFNGIRQEISLMLCPEAQVGDYVLVHVGFAIQRLEHEDALETLRLFREIEEANRATTSGEH